MIRMVIFDMAGTTVNEDNIVYKCVFKAIQKHIPLSDFDTVLFVAAGKEKRQALTDVYHHFTGLVPDNNILDEMYDHFEQLLNEAYDIMQIKLFEDVPLVLKYLRRKNIFIVFNTGYKEQIARKILAKAGVQEGKDIDLLVTADMVSKGRPAPDMIQYALENKNIIPSQCIKIGDSTIDILEGKNAGVACTFGITTGAHSAEQLQSENPSKIFQRLSELIPVLEELNASL
jgi:phosphonatase-like hydrolase